MYKACGVCGCVYEHVNTGVYSQYSKLWGGQKKTSPFALFLTFTGRYVKVGIIYTLAVLAIQCALGGSKKTSPFVLFSTFTGRYVRAGI